MQKPVTFLTARKSPALLRYFSESAPIRRSTSSTVRPEAISSERLAISMPMKQGHWMGGLLIRMWTAFVPARRNSSTIFRLVVPRTIESSTSTTRLPSRISRRGLNFSLMPMLRNRWFGWMKVRVM